MSEERFRDMDERLREVEGRVIDLRIAHGEWTATLAHFRATVDKLEKTVNALDASMNRGRGALWFAMSAAGAFGALLSILAKRIFT